MKNSRGWMFPALALIWSNATFGAVSQQALVWSLEQPGVEVGQAWMMRSADSCLAILPEHVVDEARQPAILAEGGTHRGELRNVVRLGDDLAYAEVKGAAATRCGIPLGAHSRAVSSTLGAGGIGSLRVINGDGTIGRVSVTVIDDDGSKFLRISPTLDGSRLRKGQSGALLVVEGRPLGILLSVHARTGVGTVLRVDKLLDSVASSLQESSSKDRSAEPANTSSGTSSGWRVTGWSVDPTSAATSALNLLSSEANGYWKAQVEKWPVFLDLATEGDVVTVGRIEFLNANDDADASPPTRVQVFASLDAEGDRWRAIGTFELNYKSSSTARISTLPFRARRLRLEFFGPASSKAIALGKIKLL